MQVSNLKLILAFDLNLLIYYAVLFGILSFVCKRHYSFKEWIGVAILVILGFIAYAKSGSSTLLLSMITIISALESDLMDVFKSMFYVKFAFLILNIGLSLLGVISNNSVLFQRGFYVFGNGMVKRSSLGFVHANVLGRYIFELIVLYIIGIKESNKLNRLQYCVLFLVALAFFEISGSRTAFFATIIFILSVLLCNVSPRMERVYRKLSFGVIVLGTILCTLGVVTLYIFSRDKLFVVVNNLFQTRPIYIVNYFQKFGITMWGSDTSDLTDFWAVGSTASAATLDCGYAAMLIKYGVVATVGFIGLYSMILLSKKFEIDKYMMCVVLSVAIYNISENVIMFASRNISMFILCALISNKFASRNLLLRRKTNDKQNKTVDS
jgi:hypothetical protein